MFVYTYSFTKGTWKKLLWHCTTSAAENSIALEFYLAKTRERERKKKVKEHVKFTPINYRVFIISFASR